MDKNKDFLIGNMSNEDELAIYGAILDVKQSINYNDKLIDNVIEGVDDENLNDMITICNLINKIFVINTFCNIVNQFVIIIN